jgi:hypothetical protein
MQTEAQTVTVRGHATGFGRSRHAAPRLAARTGRPALRLAPPPIARPAVHAQSRMAIPRARQSSRVVRPSRHDPEGGRMRG